MSKIVFYDLSLASDHNQRKAWSPNTWKVRYALNIKKLEFDTVWLEFHEIEPAMIKLGGKPTATKPDGTPWYTLPAIYDPATEQIVTNSRDIAEYLDKQYPTTQKLVLDPAFETEWEEVILTNVMMPFPMSTIMVLHNHVSVLSAQHLRRTREPLFGKTLEEVSTEEAIRQQWEGFEKGYTNLSEFYKKVGTMFLSRGDTPAWADLVAASWFVTQKYIYGEDSKQWGTIVEWDGGLWKKLIEALQVYEGEGLE